ncbi:hypothetical protein ABG768_008070 [Culter alburnus]|uniref:Uncharacterized protein n=1 Tax=Culter alburnus TaxID=194366 RepID=A0AAW1ZMF4_CULAL
MEPMRPGIALHLYLIIEDCWQPSHIRVPHNQDRPFGPEGPIPDIVSPMLPSPEHRLHLPLIILPFSFPPHIFLLPPGHLWLAAPSCHLIHRNPNDITILQLL